MGRKKHPASQLFKTVTIGGIEMVRCRACDDVVAKGWKAAAQHILYVCPSVLTSTRLGLDRNLTARGEREIIRRPRSRKLVGVTGAATAAASPVPTAGDGHAGQSLVDDMEVHDASDTLMLHLFAVMKHAHAKHLTMADPHGHGAAQWHVSRSTPAARSQQQ